MKNKRLIFEDKKIRSIFHKGELYFSIVDVVRVLTNSVDARKYWNKLIQRLREEGSEVVTFCHQLKLEANDGKLRETDCSTKKGIFRIIQSIPSKKAEPFKMWLAKVGSDRIDEIENPELAQNRAKEYYEKKCYPRDWIEKRLRGIAIRQDLTDEWKNREVREGKEYAILTNEISKATFGVSVREHKKIKNLDIKNTNENLRDNMDDLELIFSMLGEKVATEVTRKNNSQGFDECLDSAKEGGEVAGNARTDTEKRIGRNVVSDKNFKDIKNEEDKKIVKLK